MSSEDRHLVIEALKMLVGCIGLLTKLKLRLEGLIK